MKKFLAHIFFAYLCCVAPFCYAADLPVSTLEETTPYNTMDDAAKAALSSVAEDSKTKGVEYGGIIVQIGNQFFYTNPVCHDEAQAIDYKARFPKSGKFVAMFHTHPGNFNGATHFSPSDLELVQTVHLPSYIEVVNDGTVLKAAPGKITKSI